jgi:hypothetical protein
MLPLLDLVACPEAVQFYVSRDLSGLSLDGELPFDTSVWQPLNSLTSVNLANNNLSGFLPPQISELTNATSLNLGGNNFSGADCAATADPAM